MRIYVATSWRNTEQPGIVRILRGLGHEVYDFRHPKEGDDGFSWSDIDPNWKAWTPEEHREALKHPVARRGFKSDMDALDWCDACVLVLPCGRSAHLELGYVTGKGKRTTVLAIDQTEPELMYLMCDEILVNTDELFDAYALPAEAIGGGE